MCGPKRSDVRVETRFISEMARVRVQAVWDCVGVLCPDLDVRRKRDLATAILQLVRGENQPVAQINEAQVVEMVWRNMQCIKPYCPLLIFGRQLSEELNEFFQSDENLR
jgi:hypothetical protein